MKNGFVKVAAATPDIRVADVEFNTQNIINAMEEAQKNGAKILVFPELCVTGYTCSDLFNHSVLLKASRKALLEIAENTNDKDMLVFVGAPLEVNGKLYNVAAAMNQGEIIGLIGPNGAGKTTVFNMLTNVYQPTTGSIELEGRSIVGKKTYETTGMGIARTTDSERDYI